MEKSIIRFEPPRGMRDFYPGEMAARNLIFEAWDHAARLFGFQQYDACVVESLSLLKRKGGEEIIDQIYAFRDKSERELALRPEMTPSLARMVAARQQSLTFPLKWFTIAQCFRYERMSKGRKREHYQWNLDVIGEPALSAEAEVIACAATALRRLGLQDNDVIFKINSRALLSELLLHEGVATKFHEATFLALDKRGKINQDALQKMLEDAGLDQEACAAVKRVMAVASIEDVQARLGNDSPALTSLRELIRRAREYGLSDMLEFDISVIRGLGYYTGTVFEAFDRAGEFRALFGGGRYNRLLSDLGGSPMPAVGLGFGDVVIAELLRRRELLPLTPHPTDFAVGYMTATEQALSVRLARQLRKQGRSVDLALHPEKPRNFFSRVGRGGYQQAVFLGPDDLNRGRLRVKNLLSRTETEMPLPD